MRRPRCPSTPPGPPARRAGHRRHRCTRSDPTPRRLAASSSGAGCGFACGVVSPQTSAADLERKPIARTTGSANRVALLVTIPQGMPCALQEIEKGGIVLEDTRIAQSFGPRSGAGSRPARSEVLVCGRKLKGDADHSPCSRPDHRPERFIRERRQPARFTQLVAGAGQIRCAVDQRAIEVEENRGRCPHAGFRHANR